jgi:hypothetical protein
MPNPSPARFDLNYAIKQSACLGESCVGTPDLDALDIWVRIKELATIAGAPDYSSNLTQLSKDAALWIQADSNTIQRVGVWQDLQNANGGGAGLGNDLKAILKQAKCLRVACIGKSKARGLKAYLKAYLNAYGAPE